MLAPVLLTTTTGKSKKLDINILLTTEISIPSIEVQNKIQSVSTPNSCSIFCVFNLA